MAIFIYIWRLTSLSKCMRLPDSLIQKIRNRFFFHFPIKTVNRSKNCCYFKTGFRKKMSYKVCQERIKVDNSRSNFRKTKKPFHFNHCHTCMCHVFKFKIESVNEWKNFRKKIYLWESKPIFNLFNFSYQ